MKKITMLVSPFLLLIATMSFAAAPKMTGDLYAEAVRQELMELLVPPGSVSDMPDIPERVEILDHQKQLLAHSGFIALWWAESMDAPGAQFTDKMGIPWQIFDVNDDGDFKDDRDYAQANDCGSNNDASCWPEYKTAVLAKLASQSITIPVYAVFYTRLQELHEVAVTNNTTPRKPVFWSDHFMLSPLPDLYTDVGGVATPTWPQAFLEEDIDGDETIEAGENFVIETSECADCENVGRPTWEDPDARAAAALWFGFLTEYLQLDDIVVTREFNNYALATHDYNYYLSRFDGNIVNSAIHSSYFALYDAIVKSISTTEKKPTVTSSFWLTPNTWAPFTQSEIDLRRLAAINEKHDVPFLLGFSNYPDGMIVNSWLLSQAYPEGNLDAAVNTMVTGIQAGVNLLAATPATPVRIWSDATYNEGSGVQGTDLVGQVAADQSMPDYDLAFTETSITAWSMGEYLPYGFTGREGYGFRRQMQKKYFEKLNSQPFKKADQYGVPTATELSIDFVNVTGFHTFMDFFVPGGVQDPWSSAASNAPVILAHGQKVTPVAMAMDDALGLTDFDMDGDLNFSDNCPHQYNPDQADNDNDGVGNVCDNCSELANPMQFDIDADGYGNTCDLDFDNSGSINSTDRSYLVSCITQSGENDYPRWTCMKQDPDDFNESSPNFSAVLDIAGDIYTHNGATAVNESDGKIATATDLARFDALCDTLPCSMGQGHFVSGLACAGTIPCPSLEHIPLPNDSDGDGDLNAVDNCPNEYNPSQNDVCPERLDIDGDSVGNDTDTDDDNDGDLDGNDNCPLAANADQLDTDSDGVGDVCDSDDDADTVLDHVDTCRLLANNTDAGQMDSDFDAIGNACDTDDDNDGLSDTSETTYGTSPFDPDADDDGLSDGGEVALGTDPTDADSDNDGVGDGNEVDFYNTDPMDADTDDDGDGDYQDNCASIANANQLNTDNDSQGDACDTDDDNDGLSDTEESLISSNSLNRFSPVVALPGGLAILATDWAQYPAGVPMSAIWSSTNGSLMDASPANVDVVDAAQNNNYFELEADGVNDWYLNGQVIALTEGVRLRVGHAPSDPNGNYMCVLTDAAQYDPKPMVYCGYGNISDPGGVGAYQRITSPALTAPTDIAVGSGFACALDGGKIKCWNYFGASSVPTQPLMHPGAVRASAITAGADHLCAITDSVTEPVQCWGDSADNKLNVPNTVDAPLSIDAGDNHTCVINSNNGTYSGATSVICWGDNAASQIAPLPSMTKPVRISASGNRTCAVEAGQALAQNALVCWPIAIDTDGDGTSDYLDTDDDGDCLLDGIDPDPIHPTSGDLDCTFSGDGKATSMLYGSYSSHWDAAYASLSWNGGSSGSGDDGKILAVGRANIGGSNVADFAMIRYNLDGSVDTTFDDGNSGYDGFLYDAVDDQTNVAVAVAQQADGDIVLAGYSGSAGNERPTIARFDVVNETWQVFDTSSLTTESKLHAVMIDSQQRIVVSGYVKVGSYYDALLMRFNDDGTLDTTFNSTGIVIENLSVNDEFYAVTEQSSGKYVAAGRAGNQIAIVRYTDAGAIDTSFGSSGKTLTAFTGENTTYGYALVQLADGRLVVAGITGNISGSAWTDMNIAVASYTSGGAVDTTFNSGSGKVIVPVSGYHAQARSITAQADGKLVLTGLAGTTTAAGARDVIVVRLNTDGTNDNNFGSSGAVITDVHGAGKDDQGRSVVIQDDGKIVVTGIATSGSSNQEDVAVLRYHP